MAKKKDEPKAVVVEKSKPKTSIAKYFQYHGGAVHRYTKAFLEAQYRGIIKTKEEWDQEVAKLTEGNK